MSFRAQIDLIHTIALPPTWTKYDADNVPAQLSQARLPALVLVESSNQSGAFVEATMQQGSFDVQYHVAHILVWKPIVSGRVNKIIALGELVDFLDIYLDAAQLIIGEFEIPPRISMRRLPSIIEGQAEYYAREFVWQLGEYK